MENKLDYVATEIIDVLRKEGLDEGYINDKIERLAGLHRFQVLVWCNNLDSENKAAVAHRFGVSRDSFVQMIETLRKF